MRKLLHAFLLVVVSGTAASAQSTAIRFILGEGHGVYELPRFGNYCMGLGMDRSFNDKLTAGLDVTFDVAHALKTGPEYVYLDVSGSAIGYTMEPSLFSINYHTEYALGEDDGTHGYIGTYIGIRRLKQEWASDGTLYYSSNGDLIAVPAPPREVSKVLVPLGIRMGVRGTTDGGFMDLYGAVGYQIGGGKNLLTGNFAQAGMEYAETSALAFTIGWAYGFGW
ncbi:MAG: hypothetical protein IT230_06270 [Flavobacteriales bacterium]|nr:hypothetical protein [Flavobacteriales bacterium]